MSASCNRSTAWSAARMRSAIMLTTLSALLLAGCASVAHQPPASSKTFSDALYACRSMQPNRLKGKFQLPPSHPRIAACLERRGWNESGGQLEGSR